MQTLNDQTTRTTKADESSDLANHWILRMFGNGRPLAFDAGDSNLYRYAGNKPTIATDPSGLQIVGEDPAARIRREFFERPCGSVNATYTYQGNTYRFRVRYDYFTNAQRDLLIERLGRLRAALAEIMSVLPPTNPRQRSSADSNRFTLWSRINPAMQARLSRWFGNGQPLNDWDYKSLYRVFDMVTNAFNSGNLDFENDFENSGDEFAWAVPGTWFDIHLRPRFYTDTFPRRQIGILFHELTHYYGWTADHGYFDEASLTRIRVRGDLVRRPALPTYNGRQNLTSGQLVNNADSYEGFLEDFYLEDVPG